MTLRNREEAARAAENTHTNRVGMCQQVTRGYYMGASAGDRDHDGDADAIDGWLSEPSRLRHPGDRNPPRGVPVSFKNARSNGHGHRAISLGNGVIRSTDFNGSTKRFQPGVLGNGTIAEIERAMGLEYLGWTPTITGQEIPMPPPPPPTRLDNFWKGGPQWNVNILDRAAAQRSDIRKIVERIDVAVNKLPHDRGNSLVNQFVASYKKDRRLRMGLLNQAVKNGRHGTVQHVRDELRRLLFHDLPKS